MSGSDAGPSGVDVEVKAVGLSTAVGLGFSKLGEDAIGVELSDVSGDEGIVLDCRICWRL
jgi:hypothetical protein